MFKSIFKNPELKSVFRWFIVLYLVFAFLLLGFLQVMWRDMEMQRNRREIAMIGQLLAEHPEDEERVISTFVRERDAADLAHGLEVGKRYGISLEDRAVRTSRFYPLYQRISEVVLVLMGLWLFLFFVILFGFGRRVSGRLHVLARGADQIMDGNFTFRLPDEGEGDLAMVGFQFNQMARRLQLSMEALEQEKGLLKDLISNISHQLKTPLSSLRTYNELLLDGAMEDSAVSKEFLETSQRQIERMEWLVQTMLKISRLESGVIRMQFKKAPLNGTVEEVLDSLRLRWTAKGQRVVVKGMEQKVVSEHDQEWLGEALANILKNAMDYSENGTLIELILEERESMACVTVRDWGPGIADADLPHIFKQFYQGTNRHSSGSGVGLALAKLIIEKHGGLIHVESQLGSGTTFTITLPKVSRRSNLTKL